MQKKILQVEKKEKNLQKLIKSSGFAYLKNGDLAVFEKLVSP